MQGKQLSPDKRREVIRLFAKGKSHREIIGEAGVSMGVITLLIKPLGGVVRPALWQVSPARLSLEDRVEIKLWLEAGVTFAEIGRRLNRATSTISREVGGVDGRGCYQPVAAYKAACERAKRPKATKLAANPALCAFVEEGLRQLWSPDHISGRLRRQFPDDPEMRVSHETIYKSLFIQGRGELRRELAQCLRTGRAQRKPRSGRANGQGRITDMVSISERPPDVADRAVPGDWEGDLMIGAAGASAVGTLVERVSRLTLLLHLPDGRSAAAVRDAATQAVLRLPQTMRRSLTWDQGKEMAEHVRFSADTGLRVYFCDPHSP